MEEEERRRRERRDRARKLVRAKKTVTVVWFDRVEPGSEVAMEERERVLAPSEEGEGTKGVYNVY